MIARAKALGRRRVTGGREAGETSLTQNLLGIGEDFAGRGCKCGANLLACISGFCGRGNGFSRRIEYWLGGIATGDAGEVNYPELASSNGTKVYSP